MASSARRPPSAAAWSTARSWGSSSTGRYAAARWRRFAGPTSTSATARTFVVTLRRSKTNPVDGPPDVRRLVGGGAAAVRRLHAATTPGAVGSGRRARCSTRSTGASPSPAPRPGSCAEGTGELDIRPEFSRARSDDLLCPGKGSVKAALSSLFKNDSEHTVTPFAHVAGHRAPRAPRPA